VGSDRETVKIINNTSHHIIIRGEKGETHVVKPGETYDTKAHTLNSIDGIIFNNGQLYKVNNNKIGATFRISEKDGIYQVEADTRGTVFNLGGDILKAFANQMRINVFVNQSIANNLLSLPPDNLEKMLEEFSGMRGSTDNSESKREWPSDYQKHIMGDKNKPIAEWDKDLADFRERYPNGCKD
jgi:hypothetical protein